MKDAQVPSLAAYRLLDLISVNMVTRLRVLEISIDSCTPCFSHREGDVSRLREQGTRKDTTAFNAERDSRCFGKAGNGFEGLKRWNRNSVNII